MQNDFLFIQQFQQGDERAFETIYRLHLPKLYNFAYRLIGRSDEAEDIVGEVYLKLWELRADFDSKQNIKAFLFIATRNRCFDYLRQQERQAQHNKAINGQTSTEEDLYFEEVTLDLMARLHKAILKLPPAEKKVIEMILFDGKFDDEIATMLNRSPKTIMNIRRNATIRLHQLIFGDRPGKP